ncbi:MAG TPA: DNA polymerase III subunit delta [Vicinamibacterales bacterium]|nr:DNA polymerase III subunit delta [Vicinamibacterales bacterium]
MPALDPSALRKHIQSKNLAPIYVLYGADVRLMEQMVDAFEALIDPADRPFAAERIYAGEEGGSPIDIAGAANVFPMLGDRRLVVVLRAERFLKPARAKAAAEDTEADGASGAEDSGEAGVADLAPLEAYVDSPAPFSTLVFVAAGIDKTRRLTKRLLDKAQHVEFEGLGGENARERRDARQEAAGQVRVQIEASGKSIDPAALQMLLDRSGSDISKLRGDIERLLLYTGGEKKITRGDVEEVVTAETDVDDWGVVNAIGDGDAARALRETALRFDRGDSPHQLVGQLRWWVSQRLAPAAPDRVKSAMDALLRADLALKSSGGDERALLERLVLDLTGRPVQRPTWGR